MEYVRMKPDPGKKKRLRARFAGILKETFPEGLKFKCIEGCVKCCAIPGMVFVHLNEIPGMARHFRMDPVDFANEHLRDYWGDTFEIDFPSDEPCKFMQKTGCGIYEARPAQCSAFPFWPEYISDRGTWEKLRRTCPGIGRGRTYSHEEILDIMETVMFGPFI